MYYVIKILCSEYAATFYTGSLPFGVCVKCNNSLFSLRTDIQRTCDLAAVNMMLDNDRMQSKKKTFIRGEYGRQKYILTGYKSMISLLGVLLFSFAPKPETKTSLNSQKVL